MAEYVGGDMSIPLYARAGTLPLNCFWLCSLLSKPFAPIQLCYDQSQARTALFTFNETPTLWRVKFTHSRNFAENLHTINGMSSTGSRLTTPPRVTTRENGVYSRRAKRPWGFEGKRKVAGREEIAAN